MEVVPLEPEIIHNRMSHIAKNAVWDFFAAAGNPFPIGQIHKFYCQDMLKTEVVKWREM